MIIPSRRGFITGLAALVASPAIVRAESLMPVRAVPAYKAGVLLRESQGTFVLSANAMAKADLTADQLQDMIRLIKAQRDRTGLLIGKSSQVWAFGRENLRKAVALVEGR